MGTALCVAYLTIVALNCMLISLRALPRRFLLLPRSSLHRHRHRHSNMASTLAASSRENIPAEPATKLQRTEGPATAPAPLEALRVRRLNEHALLPKRGSAGAAGYDLAR